MAIFPTMGSWQTSAFPHAVRRTSNSKPPQPWAKARSNDAKVFSGTAIEAHAPRWPRSRGGLGIKAAVYAERHSVIQANSETGLVQIEIPDRFARIGTLFRLLDRLLEFLLQQVGGVLLRLHRLAEDGIAAAVLLFHSPGRLFNVSKHLRLHGSRVGNNSLNFSVHLQDCTTTRASDIERRRTLRHDQI